MKILFINLPYHGHVIPTIGLGSVLDYKTFTSAGLKKSAFAVLSDKKIPYNLQNMKKEIVKAPGNAGAVRIIEQFTVRKEL